MINDPKTLQNGQQERENKQGTGIDPLVILNLIKKNWYYLLGGLIVAFFGARIYISHTTPVYRVSTTILITERRERPSANTDDLLHGVDLQGDMANIENQIRLLTSRALTERALEELAFEIEYYQKRGRNRTTIYPEIPVKVTSDNEMPLPGNTEFSITFRDNRRFLLKSESEWYDLHKLAVLGKEIDYSGTSFRIECLDEDWVKSNLDKKLYFIINSRENLIRRFNSRINVERLSAGSILEVSLSGTNRYKDAEFLNKLAQVFQSSSLEKKNQEALRRIEFINSQLVGISDSLSRTENMLQEFRSRHQVMDLSSQGQAIITQLSTLERENARLALEAEYYDYLEEYLLKEETGTAPVIPITMGISDPGLTRLVSEIAELQGQLSDGGTGEMSPIQSRLIQRMQNTKEALLETINGLRKANSLALADNQEQINRVNSRASNLPETERQLMRYERRFRLNDEIYTFLLQMRSQQQMQMASNTPNSEVIDRADVSFSTLVSPNKNMVMFVALFSGAGIPLLVVFILFMANNKVDEDDIKRISDLPIVGNIPYNTNKMFNTIVFDSPGSNMTETYRMLRSKMQFFTKDTRAPVILVTSSMPKEGKTFTAINLASVYSLLGKKTIIVVFDLRKSEIFKVFDITNKHGVSTWLIGQDKLEDIVQHTKYENLSVISSGPLPPNPSELIASEKTAELVSILKEQYDYIIIDSAPIGLVSDTLHLSPLVDTCLFVVRPGHTLRNLLGVALREIRGSEMKNLCMLINGIRLSNSEHRYSKKYGYTYENPREKKYWLLDG